LISLNVFTSLFLTTKSHRREYWKSTVCSSCILGCDAT